MSTVSTTPSTPPASAEATPRRVKKNRWRGWVTPIVILTVVAIAVFFGYQRIQSARAAATAGVQTSQVTRGNLVATVNAAGNLAPAQQVNLNLSSGGIVQDVLVAQGDKIKKGQPLLRMQAQDLILGVQSANAALRSAQIKLEQARQGAKDTDFTSAQAKVDQAKASVNKLYAGPTAADLADTQARITQAQANLDKVRAGATQQDIASAQQKVEQAKNALWGAQANRDAICGRTKNPDADPSCQSNRAQVGQAEANVQIAQNSLDALLAGPNVNDVTSAEQQVAQAQAALQKLRQGPTTADVASAQAGVTQAQAALDALAAGPDELAVKVAQTAVDQAQVALDQAKYKLDQATLTAPFDGVVTAVNVVPGQSISGSTNPVTFADLSSLQVTTNVSELDRSRLKVGQDVEMTLDAVPGVTLKGKVASISPAGVLQQGVVNYPVTINLSNPDPAVAAGMTANMNIIVDSKDNVLLVPNRAIRTQGRQRLITVMVEGQQISLPVEAGMTDGTNTEVSGEGLKEGDQVVLQSTTSRNPFGGGGPNILGGGPGGPGR
ncbi:MAG: efflux RND transporter periplasmic adaptor subunit [Anaerolineae bacterium]